MARPRWNTLSLLLAIGIIAAACRGGADTATTSPADTTGNAADPSLARVRVGLISQERELLAFPEISATAKTFEAYINAELGGVDGHPIEIEVCRVGDAPESSVACAQQFVNDPSILAMIVGSWSSDPAHAVSRGAGLPALTLGNFVEDLIHPSVYAMDPGLLGIVGGLIDYSVTGFGAEEMSIVCSDDPGFLGLCELTQALLEGSGITVRRLVPIGFEQADMTGAVTAAEAADVDGVIVVLDSSQCVPWGEAIKALGVTTPQLSGDPCVTEDSLNSGALEGWVVTLPHRYMESPSTGDVDVLEFHRILDTYGVEGATPYGFTGWTAANVLIIHDVLQSVGYDDLSRESVDAALSTYQGEVPLYGPVSCPGPGSFVGQCVFDLVTYEIRDGEVVPVTDFFTVDFAQFEFLLEG